MVLVGNTLLNSGSFILSHHIGSRQVDKPLECVAKPSLMAARVGWIEILIQISPFVEKVLAKDPSVVQYILRSFQQELPFVSQDISVRKFIFGGQNSGSKFTKLDTHLKQ